MSDELEKYEALVKKLYEKTISNSLTWSMDNWSNSVVTNLPGYQIKLDFGQNDEGESLEVISIVDSNSNSIDAFNDSDLSSRKTNMDDYPTYWKLMQKLRNIATRKARGADKALDNILQALDEGDVPF
ncbi:MAG: hypothetical protein WC729_12780 [Sphingomonas sp.]|jgi:hypothetical protein|uniref:hypothetical protein n=1 Tax=Sphingomonas sp. TaxID=28214 RepID=UPI0035666B69